MSTDILSIIERAKLVAKDLLAIAETTQSSLYFNATPYITYIPSKSLLDLMNEPEIVAVLDYLKSQHYISFTVLNRNFGTGTDAYKVSVDISSLTSLTRYEEPKTPALLDIQPNTQGITFDKIRSVLTVNGTELLLGRTEGSKSLQYWVVFCTYPKPNKSIQELTILDKYDKEKGDIARKRAVRDAVIALNKKIHEKVKLEKDPFIYSSGKVTYVERITNSYQFVSVKV
jgi:hypothetical protein